MKRELRTYLKNKISTRVKAARRRREYRFYRIFLEISRIFKETKKRPHLRTQWFGTRKKVWASPFFICGCLFTWVRIEFVSLWTTESMTLMRRGLARREGRCRVATWTWTSRNPKAPSYSPSVGPTLRLHREARGGSGSLVYVALMDWVSVGYLWCDLCIWSYHAENHEGLPLFAQRPLVRFSRADHQSTWMEECGFAVGTVQRTQLSSNDFTTCAFGWY